MPAERSRKEAYYAPRLSSVTGHRTPQTRGRHDKQCHSRSAVYGPRGTSNQWRNSTASSSRQTARPTTPWRYPPLSFDLPGPGVPGPENPVQNYHAAMQAASTSPVFHSTPTHHRHYPPRAGGPASPGEKRDMWTMDTPTEARTIAASSQWATSASLSPISTLDGTPPPPRRPMTPSHVYNSSKHGAGNVGNYTGSNVDEAPNAPWLQSRVPDMSDLYVPHHPSHDARRRTIPAPPSVVPSQLAVLPSNKDETLFDPFKLLESVNFLDVDRRAKKQPTSELGRFFMNPGKVKREIADSLAAEFDEYCRSKRPMQPSARFLIRTEAAVLGRAVFHSREAILHILTDLDGLIICPYHTDIVKNYKIRGASDSRHGTQINPQTQREFRKLHCGCSEDDVVLEMMLRKLTVFPAEIEGQMSTMRGDFLNPRDRSFVCSLFRNWSSLNAGDMFKFDNDGKLRTYEDLLKAQISGLQNRLAWVEAARRQNEHAAGRFWH